MIKEAEGRGPRAEGRGPMVEIGWWNIIMCYGSFVNPRTSWLYRLWEISPAPVAIFNKLGEILDCFGYMRYM